MYRLKEMPPVRAMDWVTAPPTEFKTAQKTQTDDFAVRAAIFRVIDGEPRLLLLQRAATDSLPDRWELPGGGVEDSDASVKDALYREIKEETGLTGVWIIHEVGQGERWTKTKDGVKKHFLCVTFVVETEEIEMLERGITKAPEPGTRKFPEAGRDSTSCGEPDDPISVKLSASEHQNYMWVKEDELKDGRSGVPGRTGAMVFVSEAMRGVMLEAFNIQRAVMEAKASVAAG